MRLLLALLFVVTSLNGAVEYREERISPAEYQAIEAAREVAEQELIEKKGGQQQFFMGSDHKSGHRGSYHIYSGPPSFADQIELEDGSLWFVFPSERQKVLDKWKLGHPIAILKGDRNSNYRYRLRNEATYQIVEVELSASPYLDSFYRLTIKDINHDQRYLLLSDGSKWSLPTNWFEQEVWLKWYIGDTIMIGTNDQFFYSLFRPDILINITCSATYTPSKCLN